MAKLRSDQIIGVLGNRTMTANDLRIEVSNRLGIRVSNSCIGSHLFRLKKRRLVKHNKENGQWSLKDGARQGQVAPTRTTRTTRKVKSGPSIQVEFLNGKATVLLSGLTSIQVGEILLALDDQVI